MLKREYPLLQKEMVLKRSLLLTFFALFYALPLGALESLVVVADEWLPLNGPERGPVYGYGVDLLKEIFEPLNIKVNYKVVPWLRAISLVRSGVYDCLIGCYQSDTPDFLFTEEPIGLGTLHFFKNAQNPWVYTAIEGLTTQKFGVIPGYSYDAGPLDQYIQAHKDSPQIQEAKGSDALNLNIKYLLSGRIDILLEDKNVMDYKLKELSVPEKKILSAGIFGQPTTQYIACSPNKASSKEVVQLIDNGIRSLRSNGALETLLTRYSLKDWNAVKKD